MPSREDELGGLWIRNGSNGEFMSGRIGEQEVVIFRNDRKQPGERTPDWRVYRSKPRDGGPASASSAPPPHRPPPRPSSTRREAAMDAQAPTRDARYEDELNDSIPF